MNDLYPSFVLFGASVALVTVFGALVWFWFKLSSRFRKHYQKF